MHQNDCEKKSIESVIKDINKPTSTELRDIENKLSRISDKLSLLINS